MDCNEISCLTLKTKEIKLDIDGVQLWIDLAKVFKKNGDPYINVTQIVKDFKSTISLPLKLKTEDFNLGVTPKLEVKKRKYRVQEYLRLESTKRYIVVLEKVLISKKSYDLKLGLVYKKSGRYGGTWLHRKLFLDFARWLSPEFAVMCDQIMEYLVMHIDELKEGRDVLKKLQRPLNDAIKLKIVDTGIKTDSAYMQFAVMIKRLIGNTDDRDAYTKTQLDAAKLIIEEYRAMIIHGGKTSLKEMNEYMINCSCNLAWRKNVS